MAKLHIIPFSRKRPVIARFSPSTELSTVLSLVDTIDIRAHHLGNLAGWLDEFIWKDTRIKIGPIGVRLSVRSMDPSEFMIDLANKLPIEAAQQWTVLSKVQEKVISMVRRLQLEMTVIEHTLGARELLVLFGFLHSLFALYGSLIQFGVIDNSGKKERQRYILLKGLLSFDPTIRQAALNSLLQMFSEFPESEDLVDHALDIPKYLDSLAKYLHQESPYRRFIDQLFVLHINVGQYRLAVADSTEQCYGISNYSWREGLNDLLEYLVTVFPKYFVDLMGPGYEKRDAFAQDYSVFFYKMLFLAQNKPNAEAIVSVAPDDICRSCKGGEDGMGSHCQVKGVVDSDFFYLTALASRSFPREIRRQIKVERQGRKIARIRVPVMLLFSKEFHAAYKKALVRGL